MEKDTYRSQFRLPFSLYEKLKESADKNHTSVNSELVARLEQSFSASAANTGNLIEAIQSEAKSKGYLFSINFGEQPSISTQFEGAYRRGYHQGVAEVAYCMEEKKITNAEQLLVWVQGSGMVWRKDLPLDKMTPPPPFIE